MADAAAASCLLSGHTAALEQRVSGALSALSAAASAAKQQCSSGENPLLNTENHGSMAASVLCALQRLQNTFGCAVLVSELISLHQVYLMPMPL